VLSDWPNLRLKESDLLEPFSAESNIGLILGAASGGLVDIDCDVREAAIAAQILLPATNMIHGRLSSPANAT
jgi:hypothetical protein